MRLKKKMWAMINRKRHLSSPCQGICHQVLPKRTNKYRQNTEREHGTCQGSNRVQQATVVWSGGKYGRNQSFLVRCRNVPNEDGVDEVCGDKCPTGPQHQSLTNRGEVVQVTTDDDADGEEQQPWEQRMGIRDKRADEQITRRIYPRWGGGVPSNNARPATRQSPLISKPRQCQSSRCQ